MYGVKQPPLSSAFHMKTVHVTMSRGLYSMHRAIISISQIMHTYDESAFQKKREKKKNTAHYFSPGILV